MFARASGEGTASILPKIFLFLVLLSVPVTCQTQVYGGNLPTIFREAESFSRTNPVGAPVQITSQCSTDWSNRFQISITNASLEYDLWLGYAASYDIYISYASNAGTVNPFTVVLDNITTIFNSTLASTGGVCAWNRVEFNLTRVTVAAGLHTFRLTSNEVGGVWPLLDYVVVRPASAPVSNAVDSSSLFVCNSRRLELGATTLCTLVPRFASSSVSVVGWSVFTNLTCSGTGCGSFGTIFPVSQYGSTKFTTNTTLLTSVAPNLNISDSLFTVTFRSGFSSGWLTLSNGYGATVRLYVHAVPSTVGWSRLIAGSPNVVSMVGPNLGVGTNALLSFPYVISLDPTRTSLLIPSKFEHCIKSLNLANMSMSVYAGQCGFSGVTDGASTSALFDRPQSVVVGINSNVYVGSSSFRIRAISAGVVRSTLGNYQAGSTNGLLSAAQVGDTRGMVYDPITNRVYFVQNYCIRYFDANDQSYTLAGNCDVSGLADGVSSAAAFSYISSVLLLRDGNLLVGDSNAHCIRIVNPYNGNVTTWAGVCNQPGLTDGNIFATPSSVLFTSVQALTQDSAGYIYVSQGPVNTMRRISPSGDVVTWLGSFQSTSSSDGVGAAAGLRNVAGLVVDSLDGLYAANYDDSTIRRFVSTGSMDVSSILVCNGNATGVGPLSSLLIPTLSTLSCSLTIQTANTPSYVPFSLLSFTYTSPSVGAGVTIPDAYEGVTVLPFFLQVGSTLGTFALNVSYNGTVMETLYVTVYAVPDSSSVLQCDKHTVLPGTLISCTITPRQNNVTVTTLLSFFSPSISFSPASSIGGLSPLVASSGSPYIPASLFSFTLWVAAYAPCTPLTITDSVSYSAWLVTISPPGATWSVNTAPATTNPTTNITTNSTSSATVFMPIVSARVGSLLIFPVTGRTNIARPAYMSSVGWVMSSGGQGGVFSIVNPATATANQPAYGPVLQINYTMSMTQGAFPLSFNYTLNPQVPSAQFTLWAYEIPDNTSTINCTARIYLGDIINCTITPRRNSLPIYTLASFFDPRILTSPSFVSNAFNFVSLPQATPADIVVSPWTGVFTPVSPAFATSFTTQFTYTDVQGGFIWIGDNVSGAFSLVEVLQNVAAYQPGCVQVLS